MKVILESTARLVTLETADGDRLPARVWEGVTANGVRVHAYVTRIAVHKDDDAAEFERDLLECADPSPAVAALPARLLIG